MRWLENRVPPLPLAVAAGGVIWALARLTPHFAVALPARGALAGALVVAGLGFLVAGVAACRRLRTTVDPRDPAKATALVETGVYRFTRNPMYLGMALLLAGLAAHHANPLGAGVVTAFILWIDRLQIVPEERALAARFGPAFAAYRGRVRRWL